MLKVGHFQPTPRTRWSVSTDCRIFACGYVRLSLCSGPGDAVANYNSVVDGAKIVEQAMEKWGRVDVLINNA